MLYIIVGPSGSGKTDLVKRLTAHGDFIHGITCTTRPKRKGEIHGVDYYFYTNDEILEGVKAGMFIEHEKFKGNYYATPICVALDPREVVLVVEPNGANKLRRELEALGVAHMIVYLNTPKEQRRRYLEKDGRLERLEDGIADLFENGKLVADICLNGSEEFQKLIS